MRERLSSPPASASLACGSAPSEGALVDHVDLVLARLKAAGLKLTPQRIAIARELAGDLTHPTAQDLFERLRGAYPTMSFATVYNTLDALARCGLTRALQLGGAVRFDPNVTPHHHAVCDVCGAILDVPAAPPDRDDLARVERHAAGFRIRVEETTYRGTCATCARETTTSS